ncbi:MAG: TorF family putative porin [Opitutaceae bacterium]|jgi:uncharacterized protein (TIGR02001 family)|nr:TorF family putative porin [Opitutaceae bacterium]
MKKVAILLSSLVAGVSMLAQSNEPSSSYKVSADFTYANEYVFRGIKSAGNSFQPSIEVTIDEFYVGFWTNQPVTKNQENELDIYVGYKQQITENLQLDVVATYYWYPEARTFGTKKTYEAGVGATYNLRGLSFSAYGYYDFRLEATTLQASAGYSFPLEALGTSLDFNVYLGTVSARDTDPDALRTGVKEAYNYYGADLTLPYRLNDNAILHAGIHYASNDGEPLWADDNKLWFTLGLTVGF